MTDIIIKTDPTTRKSGGFAFITFGTVNIVNNELKNLPHAINCKAMDAKRAKVRSGIKKIFVGGIESDLTKTDISNYFKNYGKFKSVVLSFENKRNQRKQFNLLRLRSK